LKLNGVFLHSYPPENKGLFHSYHTSKIILSIVRNQVWKCASGIISCEYLSGSFPGQLFSMYASVKDNSFLEKESPEGKQVYFERQLTWVLRFLSPLTRYFREGDLRAEFASFF
jgi:hypothetical protein